MLQITGAKALGRYAMNTTKPLPAHVIYCAVIMVLFVLVGVLYNIMFVTIPNILAAIVHAFFFTRLGVITIILACLYYARKRSAAPFPIMAIPCIVILVAFPSILAAIVHAFFFTRLGIIIPILAYLYYARNGLTEESSILMTILSIAMLMANPDILAIILHAFFLTGLGIIIIVLASLYYISKRSTALQLQH